VTLMILWEEHRAECADGHGYSQFCELYGRWRKRLSPVMRQTHVAGDKLFVDWAGDTVPVIDPATGEVHAAHLFVAVLGGRAIRMRRPVGRRRCPTGSVRMSTRSSSSAAS
jgi:transposase